MKRRPLNSPNLNSPNLISPNLNSPNLNSPKSQLAESQLAEFSTRRISTHRILNSPNSQLAEISNQIILKNYFVQENFWIVFCYLLKTGPHTFLIKTDSVSWDSASWFEIRRDYLESVKWPFEFEYVLF